jgi:hypothetical protein
LLWCKATIAGEFTTTFPFYKCYNIISFMYYSIPTE